MPNSSTPGWSGDYHCLPPSSSLKTNQPSNTGVLFQQIIFLRPNPKSSELIGRLQVTSMGFDLGS